MIHRAVNQQRLCQRGARLLFSLLMQCFPDESHTAGDQRRSHARTGPEKPILVSGASIAPSDGVVGGYGA